MSYDDDEPDEVFAAPRSPNITLQNPNYDQKEMNNYEEALTKIGMGRILEKYEEKILTLFLKVLGNFIILFFLFARLQMPPMRLNSYVYRLFYLLLNAI